MTKASAAILFLICTVPLSLRSQTSSIPVRPSRKFPQLYTIDLPELNLSVASLAGRYQRDPVENGYHSGVIQTGPLRWSNDAGRSWRLTPDVANGVLLTGPDNPYNDTEAGRAFRIVLRRGPDGDYLPEVAGFLFQGELYVREGK